VLQEFVVFPLFFFGRIEAAGAAFLQQFPNSTNQPLRWPKLQNFLRTWQASQKLQYFGGSCKSSLYLGVNLQTTLEDLRQAIFLNSELLGKLI
jgi:hypothetical protein